MVYWPCTLQQVYFRNRSGSLRLFEACVIPILLLSDHTVQFCDYVPGVLVIIGC